jgi:integrase
VLQKAAAIAPPLATGLRNGTLRRTCAKPCRKNGGNLEQIKFLLGHSSIQTTERYLGSEQDIEIAVMTIWNFETVPTL